MGSTEFDQVKSQQEQESHTLNLSTQKAEADLCVFEVSLVYRVSFRVDCLKKVK